MVDVWLPYGETEICARVPTENLQSVIEARDVASAESPKEEIKKALENPINTKSLAEIVKAGDKIALALNASNLEISRLTVSSILEEIAQKGLKANDLTVFFTYEIFNPNTTDLINKLANELSSLGVNVIFHDPLSGNIYVGESADGIKVYINKIFAESKVKVAVGVVKPDPYVLYEWSGCNVVLGLSSLETIRQIFMPTLNFDNISNIVHESILRVLQLVEIDFSINIVVNKEGKIVKSAAGDPKESFSETSKIANEIYEYPVEKKADIILISPGGSPFDAGLSRACRCLENALKIIRRRGLIILVAECSKGYADPKFYEVISQFKNDLNSIEKSLRKSFSIGGFVAYRFLRAFKKAEIAIVSMMPNYYASEIPDLKIFRTANDALKYALEIRGRKSKISVFPNGNLIIPVEKEELK